MANSVISNLIPTQPEQRVRQMERERMIEPHPSAMLAAVVGHELLVLPQRQLLDNILDVEIMPNAAERTHGMVWRGWDGWLHHSLPFCTWAWKHKKLAEGRNRKKKPNFSPTPGAEPNSQRPETGGAQRLLRRGREPLVPCGNPCMARGCQ